jgi:hypothetical protein
VSSNTPLKDVMLRVRTIKHPQLEGGGGTARYMRFEDIDDVKAKRPALEAAVRAWCKPKEG